MCGGRKVLGCMVYAPTTFTSPISPSPPIIKWQPGANTSGYKTKPTYEYAVDDSVDSVSGRMCVCV